MSGLRFIEGRWRQPTPCQQWQGGKGGSAPAAPNYAAQAQMQGEQAKELNTAQTWANRPTQTTPWGQTTWSTDVVADPSTGQPVTTWSQNQTLAPELQGALNDQLAIQEGRSELARGFMGRVGDAYAQPFDWQSLPERPGGTEAATAKAYQGMETLQAPEREFQRKKLDAEMANRGIGMGSSSYGVAQRRASDEIARQQLQNMLTASAEGRAQGQYQQGVRQAAIGEQQTQRQTPLNELNALLTGQQVSSPQMPAFQSAGKVDPANLLGASQAQYNAQLGQYNAQQASADATQNAALGTVGTIGAIALM